MSDDRIDRLIDQAADITQQVIANRDKRIAELSDEVSRLNSIVDKREKTIEEVENDNRVLVAHARVMARELEAWRNDDAQHGHGGETRRHDFPEDCTVCTACAATDAAIPDLSVYTSEAAR